MKHVIAKNPRQHILMTFGPACWERAANVKKKNKNITEVYCVTSEWKTSYLKVEIFHT